MTAKSVNFWPNRDPIADQGAVLTLTRRYGKFVRVVGSKSGSDLYEFVNNNPVTQTDPEGREQLLYGPGATCRLPYEPPPLPPCPRGQTYKPRYQAAGESLDACMGGSTTMSGPTSIGFGGTGILVGIFGGIAGAITAPIISGFLLGDQIQAMQYCTALVCS